MVISASLQACGVVFPLAMLTSICRSIVTICSGLYLLIGMSRFSSKWILSHSTWYKSCRSGHVLPALVPEMTYDGMQVANGQDAGLAWESLIRGKVDAVERGKIEKALLEYCGQDTLAMVRLLDRLRLASGRVD